MNVMTSKLVAQMEVTMWCLEKITPYARNARKIPPQAIDKVAASIREFGWRVPIVVDRDGVIICGHTRLLAARKLGLSHAPVHVAHDLTPVQVRAYRLLDNRSHEETDWDFDLLGLEMGELKDLNLDLSLTGFDAREIDELLARDAELEDRANQVPELPSDPVTRPGDLWVCGSHRVLCGDATDPDGVSGVLGVAQPRLMVTDPPYGVQYTPEWREQAGLGKQRQTGTVKNDNRADWTPAYQLFPGDVIYVWHAGVHAAEVAMGIQALGFELRAQIIWAKQHFALGRGAYHWQHEPCWYAVRKGGRSNWRGDRTQSTVWQVANLNPFGGNQEESITGHGTQKPVDLMRRPILNHTERREAVYDPFLGSGTTLIAAEMTERICYGLEIDPRYCDVIVRRWQEFTGNKAMLDQAHKSFAEVARNRSEIEARKI
jgi:DNA modification methylase